MKLCEITSPAQLKGLSDAELETLAGEIRETIIRTVSRNGGHLASNLGVVELTLALHRALECPRDKLIFDVGHQCYPHKLLTGRYRDFGTLRQLDGLCGFPRMDESEYDAFGAGHASTAISAALGMARARDLLGQDYQVVAVVGDGALTGGMCHEALNDAGSSNASLMVVVNDNGMSISRNVGALSGQLNRLRLSRGWLDMKSAVSDALRNKPAVYARFQRIKNTLRNILVRDKYFSSLGFHYFGPIDGHDLKGMERIFRKLRSYPGPVVVHVVTRKGAGSQEAELHPELYHGVPPRGCPASGRSFGPAAADAVSRLARQDERVCVVTAAMTDGTGFSSFAKSFPQRTFDVGIAEEHAVTMAAGMAAAGMRPFAAIYDTFLQRSVDQIMEDVCLQNLPVCFLMDRAGLVGEDGATHHGVFGGALLRPIPNLTVLCPRTVKQLEEMILWAYHHHGPVAIRYGKAQEPDLPEPQISFTPGQWETLRPGKDAALIACATLAGEALRAAELLAERGVQAAVIHASSLKPLDENCLRGLADTPFFVLDEGPVACGLCSAVTEFCALNGQKAPAGMLGLPDLFIPHGERHALLRRYGLDAEAVTRQVTEALKK